MTDACIHVDQEVGILHLTQRLTLIFGQAMADGLIQAGVPLPDREGAFRPIA